MDVLRLSDDQHQWLRTLSSETLFQNDDGFRQFVEDVSQSIITPKHEFAAVRHLKSGESCLDDKMSLHQATAALSSLFVEAAKRNSAPDSLGLYLQAVGLQERQIKEITTVYSTKRNDFRRILSSVGFRFPVVTDVSWRLDWTIKSNEVPRVCEPIYRVSLDTLIDSKTDRRQQAVDFSLSVEELQELVWTFKNAVKSVERHAQS